MRILRRQGDMGEFIEDQQSRLPIHGQPLRKLAAQVCQAEIRHECVGRRVVDGHPVLQRFQGQRRPEMDLPSSRRIEDDDVLVSREEAERGKFAGRAFVDGGLEAEVELGSASCGTVDRRA